jgi:hypothetical protein
VLNSAWATHSEEEPGTIRAFQPAQPPGVDKKPLLVPLGEGTAALLLLCLRILRGRVTNIVFVAQLSQPAG